MYFQITSTFFTAGGEFDDKEEVSKKIAPVIRYMAGWKRDRLLQYCQQRGWKYQEFTKPDPNRGDSEPGEFR